MEKLRQAEQELFERITSLKTAIKTQEDTLATWDNNNPMILDKKTYRDSLIHDMKMLNVIKRSYILLLDQMKIKINEIN